MLVRRSSRQAAWTHLIALSSWSLCNLQVARGLLFVCCLPAASAYSHLSAQYSNIPNRFSWSLPAAVADDAGLGGGITYSIDPGLCTRLLSRFREQSQDTWAKVVNLGVTFVDCDDIYDAIGRAFGTWSSNHKLIAFKDVSGLCRRSGAARAEDCALAEVSVDSLPPVSEREKGLAAFVLAMPARGRGFSSRDKGRRTTSGTIAYDDYAIGYASMVFNNMQCWYLDNTFCAPLHSLTQLEDMLLRVGLLVVWILGFLMLFLWLSSAMRRVYAEVQAAGSGSGASVASHAAAAAAGSSAEQQLRPVRRAARSSGFPRVRAAASGFFDSLENLSGPGTTLCLLLIAAPPLMYIRIYLPCVECYDFEAAAAHEIGHLLGFHHPDASPNYYAAAGPMRSSICTEPLASLEKLGNVSQLADSIMFSTTTHKARACLSSDDLDGLNYLYPSCDLVRTSPALCVKSKRRSGYLRMLLAMGVPVLLGVLITQLLVCYAARRERKRFTQLAKDLHAVKRSGSLGALQHFDTGRLKGKSWRWGQSSAADDGPAPSFVQRVRMRLRGEHVRLGNRSGGGGNLKASKTMRDFATAARSAGEAAEAARRRANARAKWLAGGCAAIASAAAHRTSERTADASEPNRARGPLDKPASSELREALHVFEATPIFAWVRKGELGALRRPLSRLSRGLREMHAELRQEAGVGLDAGGAPSAGIFGVAAWVARKGRGRRVDRVLPGGKVGAKHDLYRRLSNQLPLCVDAFVDGDELESRDLAMVIRGVEALEEAGLHQRPTQPKSQPPAAPSVSGLRKVRQEERANLDRRASERQLEQVPPSLPMPNGLPASESANGERDTFVAWSEWKKADPKKQLPTVTPKPEDVLLPWDSPRVQAGDSAETVATRSEGAQGPQWKEEQEAAAWCAWTKAGGAGRAAPACGAGGAKRMVGTVASVGNAIKGRSGGSGSGSGSAAVRNPTGCHGLRYAPLVRKEERATFLRWFADVSQLAERAGMAPTNGDSTGDSVPAERSEAAKEANAALQAVVGLIANLEEQLEEPAPGGARVRGAAGAMASVAGFRRLKKRVPVARAGPAVSQPGCITPAKASKMVESSDEEVMPASVPTKSKPGIQSERRKQAGEAEEVSVQQQSEEGGTKGGLKGRRKRRKQSPTKERVDDKEDR